MNTHKVKGNIHIMGLTWFWVPINYPKPSFRVLENQARPLAVTPNPWMNTHKVKGNIHIMGLTWFWVPINYPKPSFRVLENQVRPPGSDPKPMDEHPQSKGQYPYHGSNMVLGSN